MTKPKRAFAEMLVAARGSGDVDDICENMSLMDIIYELKRLEKEEEAVAPPSPEPEPVREPSPPPAPSPEPRATSPPPTPAPSPEPRATSPSPARESKFRPNFWSRLTGASDDEST